MLNFTAHFLSDTFFFLNYIAVLQILRDFRVKSKVKCAYRATNMTKVIKELLQI